LSKTHPNGLPFRSQYCEEIEVELIEPSHEDMAAALPLDKYKVNSPVRMCKYLNLRLE